MKPHFIVVDLDGNETEVIRTFGEMQASNAANPIKDHQTIQDRLSHIVSFQCHAALQRTGEIPADMTLVQWVETITDIKDPPDPVATREFIDELEAELAAAEDDDDDPFGRSAKG